MSMYGEGKKHKPGSRLRTAVVGESLTDQSAKAECDINEILKRAEKTGLLGHVNGAVGAFVDVSDLPDYRAALDIVREADSNFMSLPAETRLRFKNNPAELLEFLGDEKNRPEAERLGLVEPKEPKAPREPGGAGASAPAGTGGPSDKKP